MLDKLLKYATQNAPQIGFILAGVMIIYFFILRPKQKEERERSDFIKDLKPGVQVVTIGGIHGKVLKVEGAKIIIEADPRGFQLVLNKQAVLPKNT